MYYQLEGQEDYSFNAELFDWSNTIQITSEIYVEHKPNYYPFLSSAQKLTEQDVIDLYSIK